MMGKPAISTTAPNAEVATAVKSQSTIATAKEVTPLNKATDVAKILITYTISANHCISDTDVTLSLEFYFVNIV